MIKKMKKSLVFLILAANVVFPLQALAAFQLPNPANLTVVVNVTGGDDSFHFNINYGNVGQFLFTSADIQTNNGVASQTFALSTFGVNTYFINPTAPAGWEADNITCVTDNPNNGLNIFTDFVQITNPVSGSNTTCIFNNSKVGSKAPILIVPGLFGTHIEKDGTKLWLDLEAMKGDWGDEFMDPLQFKNDLTPLDTSLVTGSVIRFATTTVITEQKYDYTEGLINLLTSPSIGYIEGNDLFTFPYDWRFGVSDNTVNQLKGQMDYILNQTDAGKAAGKVDVIAHSTGGLIVKKYVIENPTDHGIGKAVFLGVPNLGALKAIKVLLIGDGFDIFFLADGEMKKISQNMPIAYDLAPSNEYYNSQGSFYHFANWDPDTMNTPETKDLNFDETYDRLKNSFAANSTAINNAQTLHSQNFDNYDLRTDGVDLYNVVGCKTGTIGKIYEYQSKSLLGNIKTSFEAPKHISGDGTVPFGSADSLAVDNDHTFFVPKANHGKMPSADGIRQQIANLLTGSSLSTNGKILTHEELVNNPDLCEIKGEQIKIKSPVDIGVTDQDGNFSGLAEDGSIQNDIPGADYEIWGEHKYVFLPTDAGQVYDIQLKGTGNGTFTLDDESIDGDTTTQTQVFSNLPVTTALTGQVNLGSTTTLSLDTNGDGTTDQTIQPSSILNSDESQDLISPVSTSTLAGLMGQAGFYRGEVSISLASEDPSIPDQESQTSGVLKTVYKLDNNPSYQPYNSPIVLTEEGQHTISFFSTDRAGNNEIEQTIGFTIDKTAPEFIIQFNPNLKDLEFTATDTSPTLISTSTLATLVKKGFKGFPKAKIKFTDSDDVITATDSSGNVTKVTLKDKDRKRKSAGEIKSLSYNNQIADISKNKLIFDWKLDKQQNLKELNQHVKSKKDFNIDAEYQNNKTTISGKDQNGKIKKTIPGIVLLKITTTNGDLNWNY